MFAHHVGPLGDHPRTSVNFSRASRLRTVESCQSTATRLRMPLAFKAAAMALGLVTLEDMISRTIGSTFAAKASALARLVARTFSCASSKLVRLPSGSHALSSQAGRRGCARISAGALSQQVQRPHLRVFLPRQLWWRQFLLVNGQVDELDVCAA